MTNNIIISDTSCLIALQRISQLDILELLFRTVIITEEVKQEFQQPLPPFIIVTAVKNVEKKNELNRVVDSGEASAIALGLEVENCVLIIDEKKGRKLAESLKLKIAGTLQVLLLAKLRGVIPSLKHVLSELEVNNFRFSTLLKEEALRRANEL